ncbi:recombinase RecT [Burkholderia seminalis]|uniref:RecT family recombinase n=1 Tax=Burkholderia seminalis TaxID=488731 RepID=UPI001CF32968|nr:RecT family recombinase [Burkholderia seminalis]MCA8427826.1 recombinase RecT [Burkholderia seminalis]
MSEVTTLTPVDNITPITEIPSASVPSNFSSASLVLSDDTMERMIRIADMMASGRATIPKHLQQKPGDCFAVCMQAMQWGMNPFAVAQKTHLVGDTLGYEAQLVIAVMNSSPALATRLNFAWSDNWDGVAGKSDNNSSHWAEVWAIVKGETEPRVLRVSMAQVGKVRNSPNWDADPRQQLAYLAAKRWGRLHAPDVILGVYTPDELQDGVDYGTGQPISTPRATPTQIARQAADSTRVERDDRHVELIRNLEKVASEYGSDALAEAWSKLTKEDRKAIGTDELNRLKKLAATDATPQQEGHETARDAASEGQAGADADGEQFDREPGIDDE